MSNRRLNITDATVAKLPLAVGREYVLYRDQKLKGFIVKAYKNRRVFKFESERRADGKRRTISEHLGVHPHTKADEARAKAAEIVGRLARGEPIDEPKSPKGVTLGRAYAEHVEALRGQGSERWAYECESTFRRCLNHWRDETLASLSDRPEEVRDWHQGITRERGPYEANHAGQLLRAVYRRAQKLDRTLPALPPTTGIRWNKDKRADRAIPFQQFTAWARQVDAVESDDPTRAAYHRLCVLTGCRPGELARLKWSDVDARRRTITIQKSKSGADIVLPMSAPIARELKRARDAGRIMHDGSSHVFPGSGAKGHLIEWHERHRPLSHGGNAGRHTYRTVAASMGIDELTIRLLQGHALSGVSQGYITRHLLVGTSLRAAQRRISQRILELMAGH